MSSIPNVGSYAILVIKTLIKFAVLTVVGLEKGYAKAFRKNTYFELNKILYHRLVGSFGDEWICMACSELENISKTLMSSSGLSNFLSLTQA